MSGSRVELAAHVLTPRRLKELENLLHTLPLSPHRIGVPGKKSHRGAPVHLGGVFWGPNVGDALHHGVEHPHRGHKAAQLVGDIGVHHLGVPADPVRRGPVGLESPVIGPQGEGGDETADVSRPLDAAQHPGQEPPEGHQYRRLLPRSGEDAAIHCARVINEIGPGLEGPQECPSKK